MNLLALAARWEEVMAQTAVSFTQERCLYTHDKFASCTACQNICPIHAIQFGPPPTFNKDACQQCRACLPVCPVGAYAADDEVEALLNCATRLDVQTCEIVCSLNPNIAIGDPAAAAIRVRGCLAGLGVGAYLSLANQGLTQIIVRLDACAGCPWSELCLQIESQVKQAQRILAAWKLDNVLLCAPPETAVEFKKRPYWSAGSPPVSRRDLFRWRKKEKETEAEDKNVSKYNPFRERLRILQAFRKRPLTDHNDAVLDALGFALVSINADCTACGVCARACPTGALQLTKEDGSFQLNFTPQACIGCDICSHVCVPQAITIEHAATYNQIFNTDSDQIVQQGSLTQCAKCNTYFADKGTTQLCPPCEFRRQNRFGSTLPPRLTTTLNNKTAQAIEARSR